MFENGKLLIIDDNQSVLKSLKLFMKDHFSVVSTTSDPSNLPELMASENFDTILLDMNFKTGKRSGKEGLYWLNKILHFDPLAVVVLITAYGDVELAVRAIKEGATDFVLKPWNNKKLLSTLQAAIRLRWSRLEIKSLKNKQELLIDNINRSYVPMIGQSIVMKKVFSTIEKLARTNVNVLLFGENGTGKELVAREIHRRSKRRDEIFVSVDLATISETLFESELFGHKKGAFTDAKDNRIGRFESASGGSLFLDEIGNLPINMQSKLLTAIQDRMVVPVGSNNKIPIDVRLISATNKDIDKLVIENLFREDLYYRINTIVIEIPPLRERGEDIILLSNFYLKRFSEKYEKPLLKISARAYDGLTSYNWPGNIRELKHTIEKSVILSESNTIKPESFNFKGSNIDIEEIQTPSTMEEYEKQIIVKVLKKHSGIISYTAKELDISRQTLYRKMEKYGL
ncbi:sigma-54-dependent transcriptional regulator [Bacteroidota bacterium]